MNGQQVTETERMWMRGLMAQLISLAVFCVHMASAPRDRRRQALAMLRRIPAPALRLTEHYAASFNFWLDLEPLVLEGDSPEEAMLLAQFLCVLAQALADLLAKRPKWQHSKAPTGPQRSSLGRTVQTPCRPKNAYRARSRGPPPGLILPCAAGEGDHAKRGGGGEFLAIFDRAAAPARSIPHMSRNCTVPCASSLTRAR